MPAVEGDEESTRAILEKAISERTKNSQQGQSERESELQATIEDLKREIEELKANSPEDSDKNSLVLA